MAVDAEGAGWGLIPGFERPLLLFCREKVAQKQNWKQQVHGRHMHLSQGH